MPWRRKWQPTPVLLLGKFHGQRSPVGYSVWGRKESDTTERLHSLHFSYLGPGSFFLLRSKPPQGATRVQLQWLKARWPRYPLNDTVCTRAKSFQPCLFATLWTGPRRPPLSMGLSRQEHWSGVPCAPPGGLPDPGIEPVSLASPALATGPPGNMAGTFFVHTQQPRSVLRTIVLTQPWRLRLWPPLWGDWCLLPASEHGAQEVETPYAEAEW